MAKHTAPTPRRAARETALRILYTLEVGRALRDEVIQETIAANGLDGDTADFARALVLAVGDRTDDLDETIAQHAIGYPPERQTVVDRAILRMTLAEWTGQLSDATPSILVTEAVEIAKKYSTPEAARFIHGVLGGALARTAPTPSQETPVA